MMLKICRVGSQSLIQQVVDENVDMESLVLSAHRKKEISSPKINGRFCFCQKATAIISESLTGNKGARSHPENASSCLQRKGVSMKHLSLCLYSLYSVFSLYFPLCLFLLYVYVPFIAQTSSPNCLQFDCI